MKIGIVVNTKKAKALAVVNSFVEILQKRNIEMIFDEKLKSFLSLDAIQQTSLIGEIGTQCDVVVAFGGDGTILATAKHVGATGVPILGVNIGTLGFLAEVTVDELAQTIDDLLAEKYSIVERMVFKIEIARDYLTKTYYALNDVVLDKGLSSRLIYIDVKVDGTFLNSYRADGLIVATPTGSTAYSMSAGGPLVVPKLHAFIVTPICPHSITERPIVLAEDSAVELSIRKEAEPVQLNIDGQNRYKLLFHETVRITKADYNVRWISIGKGDFFNTLRNKLNWGVNHNGVA